MNPEITKINLEASLETIKEEPPIRFYCTRCTRKFKTIEKRDIHETGHDNNNKCSKCKYQLKSIHAYEKHVEHCLAKPTPKFICNICGKEVSSKLNLNGHLATHKKSDLKNNSEDSDTSLDEKFDSTESNKAENQTYFYCTRCLRKFKTKTKRDIHETGHDNNYKCGKCGYQLKTIENYEKHVGRCSGPYKSSKKFICSYCGKIASTKANLNSHVATHGDFRCELCDLNFDQKLKFRSHMLIHETGKTIECKICGKKFGRSSNFYNHQRIHLGLTKFKCQICGSGFIKESNLETHYSMKHTGEVTSKQISVDELINKNKKITIIEEIQVQNPIEQYPGIVTYSHYFNSSLNHLNIPSWSVDTSKQTN